jgi:two-component system, LytTR family, response regulator
MVESFIPTSTNSKKIIFPTSYGFQIVKPENIIYCQADQNYTKVFLVDSKELLISKPLNHIEELLSYDFFYRIHKSFLVNINFINAYNKVDGPSVILENGTKLPVATRRNKEFIDVLTKR